MYRNRVRLDSKSNPNLYGAPQSTSAPQPTVIQVEPVVETAETAETNSEVAHIDAPNEDEAADVATAEAAEAAVAVASADANIPNEDEAACVAVAETTHVTETNSEVVLDDTTKEDTANAIIDALAAAEEATLSAAASLEPPPALPEIVIPPIKLEPNTRMRTRSSPSAAAAVGSSEGGSVGEEKTKKRRTCKFPGCTSTVKSQGHCQRHGAKPKRCKFSNCPAQAQGSHKGYCKKHWREIEAPEDERLTPRKSMEEDTKIEASGFSVYDEILPASFAFKSSKGSKVKKEDDESTVDEEKRVKIIGGELIPIAQHFVDNAHLEAGWHRKNERLARGIRPPKSASTQLEPWEKQLAVLEIALMAGTGCDHTKTAALYHKHIAHAWGREKGFHKIILEHICVRRGELERKKRKDSGMKMSPEKLKAYKEKFVMNRALKKRKLSEVSSPSATMDDEMENNDADIDEALRQTRNNVTAEEVMHMAETAVYETVAAAGDFTAEGNLNPPPPMEPPSIEEMVEEEADADAVEI